MTKTLCHYHLQLTPSGLLVGTTITPQTEKAGSQNKYANPHEANFDPPQAAGNDVVLIAPWWSNMAPSDKVGSLRYYDTIVVVYSHKKT